MHGRRRRRLRVSPMDLPDRPIPDNNHPTLDSGRPTPDNNRLMYR